MASFLCSMYSKLPFYYRLYSGVTNLDMELHLSKKIIKIYSPSIGNEN